jgi:hypothetical protein
MKGGQGFVEQVERAGKLGTGRGQLYCCMPNGHYLLNRRLEREGALYVCEGRPQVAFENSSFLTL